MLQLSQTPRIYYSLRIASAMCCIGHGAFGLLTKPIWCNYFAVFGIGQDWAYRLMPVVGTLDILAGIAILLYPLRIFPAWLVAWGILTALLRPLSGEPFAEFIERAGNFGAPLGLLILTGGIGKKANNIFSLVSANVQPDEKASARLLICLRVTGFLLLLGHGWLNVILKKGLLDQYSSIGFNHPASVALTVGVFEIAAAILLLIRPVRSLLLAFLIWKMASELFYPHHAFFEWVERGGSYGVLLALWFALDHTPTRARQENILSGRVMPAE